MSDDRPFDQDEGKPAGTVVKDGIVYTDGVMNIYATEALRTKKQLWNWRSRTALDQAIAFATYGEYESAGDTIKDFVHSFTKRYGSVPMPDSLAAGS